MYHAMDKLALTTIFILAEIVLFPGGKCVPSPLHSHRYVYKYDIGFDIDIEMPPPGAHNRVRRKTGRGSALDTWACHTITTVPNDIRTTFPLDEFYQKYTHAYGVPIVSSSNSQDAALTRACYEVRFLLADRQDIRDAMYDQYGRVGVIAPLPIEQTTDIPEHSHLSNLWDDRARGLGGVPSIPITTDGEENILCETYLKDRWHEEDVLLHEFAHSIHLISLNRINESFQPVLTDIYNQAKLDNLWSNTYAITNIREYFAEGVQGFFNVQTCRSFVDNVHNNICKRNTLKTYDPRLYDLIVDVFPCMNIIVDRCVNNQDEAANHVLRMNCDVSYTTADSDTATATDTATDTATVTTTVRDNATSKATSTPKSGADCTHGSWHWIVTSMLLIISCSLIN